MDHTPPDWLKEEPDYFITLCGHPRGVNQFAGAALGPVILESIRYRNEKQSWYCHIAVLMPDHIHLMVSFPDAASFVPVIRNWKHWLARKYHVSWQENFFDHRIRGGENYSEKAEYIMQNPVRAGLVRKAEDWPYAFIAGDLQG